VKLLLLLMMLGDLNVMDFGAVGGQGATDDTAAIQLALDTARQMVRIQQPAGGSYQGGQPTVFFPAGRYHITSQLNIPSGYACLRGEDAMIIQDNPTANILNFTGCYRNRITGLHFLGGKRQLNFANANIDTTKLTVRDCTFQGWSETAIVAEATVGDLHLSASLLIENCVWDGGSGLLTRCDFTRVRDSVVLFRGPTITDGSKWGKSLHANGQTILTGCVMTPSLPQVTDGAVTRNANVYWFDNAGSFISEQTRWGGEGGGAPIVRHISGPNLVNPWRGQAVVFRDCQTNCGKDADPFAGIITLDGGLPQSIQVSGCNGLVSGTIPLIRSAAGYDLQAAVDSITASALTSLPMYSITFRANQFVSAPGVPAPLLRFVK
jgi:hypothetical protein